MWGYKHPANTNVIYPRPHSGVGYKISAIKLKSISWYSNVQNKLILSDTLSISIIKSQFKGNFCRFQS